MGLTKVDVEVADLMNPISMAFICDGHIGNAAGLLRVLHLPTIIIITTIIIIIIIAPWP
jgi:hypothetical protein